MSEKTVTYIYHENLDIHEFRPHVSTHEVLPPFIEVVNRIVPDALKQEKPCVLIIWNLEDAEIFPLRFQQAYFQRILKIYGRIPPAFVLYLTNRASDDAMIRRHFTNTRDTRKVYRLEQRDKGIEWLIGCRDKDQNSDS